MGLWLTAMANPTDTEASSARAEAIAVDKAQAPLAAAPDSLDMMDEDDTHNDSTRMTRKNTAKGFNALDYVLEGRYRTYGEEFTRRWDDHLFVEGGLGMQQIVPPSSHHGLTPMTVVHAAIGKQFNRLHTARLSVSGAMGYRRDRGTRFTRAALAADWLFSLSSYFGGYSPTRLLDVSTVLGGGLQYTLKTNESDKKAVAEAHAGVQLRFFTGPQGYFAIEPYVGIGTDNMDDSGKGNWRKMDFFYGANLKMIYYIHNNLSAEDRLRYSRKGRSREDKEARKWRTPWFAEFGGSLNMETAERMNFIGTLGHGMTISAGRWFSPVVGLRASYSMSATRWLQYEVEEVNNLYHAPAYNINYNNINSDVRVEAMLNPMGFFRGFDWNSPYGVYAVGGIGMGWMVKNQREVLKCYTVSYSAGLHFFARLADGLQVFVEPHYVYYDYRIPYRSVSMSKRFGDNAFSLNVGLTVFNSKPASTGKQAEGDEQEGLKHFTFGAGVGTNLIYRRQTYGENGLSYNGSTYAEYHITKLHSVRAAFEYMSMAARTRLGCQDVEYNIFDEEMSRSSYNALYKSRYNKGLVSLTYLMDMMQLFCGTSGQRQFTFEAFAGPALMLHMSAKHELDPGEQAAKMHRYELTVNEDTDVKWGINAGVKLGYNIKPGLTVVLTPQLYAFRHNPMLVGYQQSKPYFVKSLSLGVQYSL